MKRQKLLEGQSRLAAAFTGFVDVEVYRVS